MKAILFVAMLLFGCSIAKGNQAKRALTCSGFPKQLSGRLYTVEVDESGFSETFDMTFNLDLNLQRMQEEEGDEILIMDFKEGKLYEHSPEGCYSEPLEEKTWPEFLQDLPFTHITTGLLGYKGASVDCYSFQDDEGVGVVTLESGDQCIPVFFAEKRNDSALAGSFLDLKTTVQPEKLKIPDECKQAAISQRSIPAMIQKLRMKTAMKRMFPLMFEALHARRKRRFPWVVPKLHKIRNRK
ncbi:uncharacterized protein LOC110043218 [Orbicella faveolata]|uniref:uncharacterized protein LOC110043218 n=1 Tax=Orbicella faveolata TaxID=48498 RepID=UPI0009E2A863|nr:uncharacterized protein LOC110043218 [Orbicella faveolata]